MINEIILQVINEIQTNSKTGSIELLNHNRIDVTDDIAYIAFRVPKLTNVCPSGFHPDSTSGYCISNSSKGVAKPYTKLGKTCPKGFVNDSASGYCRPSNKKMR